MSESLLTIYPTTSPPRAPASESKESATSQKVRDYVKDYFNKKLAKEPRFFKWKHMPLQALSFVGVATSGVGAILGIVRLVSSYSIPGVIMASMVCSIFGGVVSLIMGCSSFVQGVQTLCKGELLKGFLLVLQGLLMTAIGVILIAGPLLLKFAAGAAITAAIANPIVLPILSIMLSCVILALVMEKILPMWAGTDLGTQVTQKFDQVTDEELSDHLLKLCLPETIKIDGEEELVNFDQINQWVEEKPEKIDKVLKESIRHLKQNVGKKNSRAIIKIMLELLLLEQINLTVSQEKEKLSSETISQLEHLITQAAVTDTTESIALQFFKNVSPVPELKERQIVPLKTPETPDHDVTEFVTARLQLQAQRDKIDKQKQELSDSITEWKIVQSLTLPRLFLSISASSAIISPLISPTNSYQFAVILQTLGNSLDTFQSIKNEVDDYTAYKIKSTSP